MSLEGDRRANSGTAAGRPSSSSICAGAAADIANILHDKDRIIRAQARRIGQLEAEIDRARRDRDSLATKVALLTYKLEMYSKEQRPPQTMNPRQDRNQLSGNRPFESTPSSSSSKQSSHLAAATPKEVVAIVTSGREIKSSTTFYQQQRTTNTSRGSSSPSSLFFDSKNRRLQKRTSDEDDKIKRSRDWDYELSHDLQAKQLEMLERKYGGAIRASQAAAVIQQAYRKYCLNKNFAKLRLEADTKRLSRRFTDFGRSKTIWTDGGGTIDSSSSSSSSGVQMLNRTAELSQETPANRAMDAETDICSRMITHSSSAFSSYYCKVLQKSLSMSVSTSTSSSSSERSIHQQPAANRYAPNVDLNPIRETTGLNVIDGARHSREENKSHRTTTTTTMIPVENVGHFVLNADVSDWNSDKMATSGSFGVNGNDDDLMNSTASQPSYVDHNMIDNNLDYDVEGNASDDCVTYDDDQRLSDTTYCNDDCLPVEMSGDDNEMTGDAEEYYDNACQQMAAPCSQQQQQQQLTSSCPSPSGNIYSSLRLSSLKHNGGLASSSSSHVSKPSNYVNSNSILKQHVSSTGSPVWKRKNSVDAFSHDGECHDRRSDLDPSVSGCNVPQFLQMTRGIPILATCKECAHVLNLSHNHHIHILPQPQPKVSDKQRKRIYRIGLNLFNKKPEKGVRYLVDRRFLDNRPNAVARFLISRKGLSKQMIGEYLGNIQKQFNMEVLRCFAEEIDLNGLEIDVALRKFQSFFRMPGEAQKIERLMEAFASQYCQSNQHVVRSFRRPDTVFLLAFATIMLNTDLHNKSIKPERKMKLDEFIRNLRGIDDGEDIDRHLLSGIYERIKINEFTPGLDHVTQVAKVEQSIVGKRPQLSVLHRRLVCYCRLYEVQDLNRREKLGLHQREVFLFNDMLMVTKILGKKKNSVSYSFRSSFCLSGMIVYLFDTPHYKYGIRLAYNGGKKDYIMLYARNEHDRTKFVEDLKEAILEMNEMEALRIEEELQKQKMQQKHCNFNRHSKDSGVVDIELLRPSDFMTVNRHSTADCASVSRGPISGSLVDVTECGHGGSAGSLDSGLVSIHPQCEHNMNG